MDMGKYYMLRPQEQLHPPVVVARRWNEIDN